MVIVKDIKLELDESIKNRIFEIRRHIVESFKDINLNEETHVYTQKSNGRKYPSVSGVLKQFFDPFDPQIKYNYASKMGLDVNDVDLSWIGEGDIANHSGTRVHLFGENYVNWKYFGIGERPNPSCKKCLAIISFWNDMPNRYVPIFTELQMYNEKLGYAGTCDILAYDIKTDSIVILDYKTNKEIFSDFKKKILKIDADLHQDEFSKYTVQFNLYQILLEEIGYKVSNRILIWLCEEDVKNENGIKKLYRAYRTIDCSKEIREKLYIKS